MSEWDAASQEDKAYAVMVHRTKAIMAAKDDQDRAAEIERERKRVK